MKYEFAEKISPKKNFSALQAQFVYRYAGWILLLTAVISVLALPLAKNLKLRANFMDLLPADTQSIIDLKELNQHVGGSSYLIAVLESPSEENARLGAKKLAERVAAFPEVGYVNNKTDVPAFASRKLLFLSPESVEKLHQDIQGLMSFYRRKANPFYLDLMDEKAPTFDLKSYDVEEKVSRIGGFSANVKMFRSTFASNLVMSGVDIYAVSKLLGHHDVKITEKNHAHLTSNFLGQSVQRLSASGKVD